MLYVGVTNDIESRVAQHRQGLHGFTAKYRIVRLVYYETTNDVTAAISREKVLKRWTRARKIQRIESMNPAWDDLLPA